MPTPNTKPTTLTQDREDIELEAREASRQGISGVPFFAAYRYPPPKGHHRALCRVLR